jgi:hypothetical protein
MKKQYACSAVKGHFGKLLPRLNADDIDRWFAELAKARSVRHRDKLVERIAGAISRFMMIDEDILRQALLASPCDLGEDEPANDLPNFSL